MKSRTAGEVCLPELAEGGDKFVGRFFVIKFELFLASGDLTCDVKGQQGLQWQRRRMEAGGKGSVLILT